MKKSTKIILIVLFVIAGIFFVGKIVFDNVMSSDYMISRSIKQRNSRNDEVKENYMNKDKITVVLVGTAGPMSPDIAQTSTAVFVNGQFLLFDAGDYAQKRMV